jgi:hypothetical protein
MRATVILNLLKFTWPSQLLARAGADLLKSTAHRTVLAFSWVFARHLYDYAQENSKSSFRIVVICAPWHAHGGGRLVARFSQIEGSGR